MAANARPQGIQQGHQARADLHQRHCVGIGPSTLAHEATRLVAVDKVCAASEACTSANK
jgi:hypothetical protein